MRAIIAMLLVVALASAGVVLAQGESKRNPRGTSRPSISPEAAARSASRAAKDTKGGVTEKAPVGHGSITANLPCSACHTPDGWAIQGGARGGSGAFDHARTGFPLAGRHQGAGCTDCHRPGRTASRVCTSCHIDEHQGRLGQDCARCHTAVGWHDRHAIDLHRLTRLPLAGMHAVAACADCHRRRGEGEYSNVPAECFACHEDDYRRPDVHPRHVGTATAPAFPRECEQCHRTAAWTPAIVDLTTLGAITGLRQSLRAGNEHDIHFPITFGSHRGAPCASCHEGSPSASTIRCTGCHAHNPIRLRQAHRSVSPQGDGRSCLGCHPGGMAR